MAVWPTIIWLAFDAILSGWRRAVCFHCEKIALAYIPGFRATQGNRRTDLAKVAAGLVGSRSLESAYLGYGKGYLGGGIFVMRHPAQSNGLWLALGGIGIIVVAGILWGFSYRVSVDVNQFSGEVRRRLYIFSGTTLVYSESIKPAISDEYLLVEDGGKKPWLKLSVTYKYWTGYSRGGPEQNADVALDWLNHMRDAIQKGRVDPPMCRALHAEMLAHNWDWDYLHSDLDRLWP